MNYTKKELFNIYVDARCEEINDPKLERIKKALYIIAPLGQFSKDSFEDIIILLNEFDDEKLHQIDDNFAMFYKLYSKNNGGLPNDFYYCGILLSILYTDYHETKDYDELKELIDKLDYLIHNLKNDTYELLCEINPNLAYIFNDFMFYNQQAQTFKYINAIKLILPKCTSIFLNDPNYYNYDYTLPFKAAINIANYDELMNYYINCNNKELFIHILLDFFIKEKETNKILDFEEFQIANVFKKSGFSYNFSR